MGQNKKEWGAIATLFVAIVGVGYLFGDLNGRLKSIEQSNKIEEEKQRILKEVDKLIAIKISNFETKLKNQQIKKTKDLKPSVEFTYPEDNDYLKENMVVRGKSRNFPEKTSLWIFVFNHQHRNYTLQKRPADVALDGDWSAPVTFGDFSDNGKNFDAILIGVTGSGKTILEQNAYKFQHLDSLDHLPVPLTIYDRITGRRTGS